MVRGKKVSLILAIEKDSGSTYHTKMLMEY
jgi:hypothetical protein